LVDLVYPPRCPICDEFSKGDLKVCDTCKVSAHMLEAESHLGSEYLSTCLSCYAYEGKMKDALHRFKYRGRMDQSRFFGDEIAARVRDRYGIDVIVFVPMHKKKLVERGFNQAALIARRAARSMKMKLICDAIVRLRDDTPQVGLLRDERIKNVKGAFAANPKRRSAVNGRRILLIDDVMTTGATLDACAKELRKLGAKDVIAATVARTI
jgi:ComF family protein